MRRLCLAVAAVLVLATPEAWCSDPPPSFTEDLNFPSSYYSSVVGDALGDGRFILYQGGAAGRIFIESEADSGTYVDACGGYGGDPGFLAVAPDGHTCMVCSGSGGNYWFLDAHAPADAGAAFFSLANSYSGVWISSTQLIVDYAIGSWPNYEAYVGILDVSNPLLPVFRDVVDSGGGARAASAAVNVSAGYVYVTDGLTGATSRFAVTDLVDAFNNSTLLEWPAVANFGTYNSGGCAAVSEMGALLFPGWAAGVELFVDPSGISAGAVDPNPGGGGGYAYSAIYNEATGVILCPCTDWSGGWGTNPEYGKVTGWRSEPYEGLPVAGFVGLSALAGAIALAGWVRTSKRRKT